MIDVLNANQLQDLINRLRSPNEGDVLDPIYRNDCLLMAMDRITALGATSVTHN